MLLLPQLLDIIKQLGVATLSGKIILCITTMTNINDVEILDVIIHTCTQEHSQEGGIQPPKLSKIFAINVHVGSPRPVVE